MKISTDLCDKRYNQEIDSLVGEDIVRLGLWGFKSGSKVFKLTMLS